MAFHLSCENVRMFDEKKIEDVAPDAIAAQSDYIESNADPGRALVGKIARLPRDIREQLNHRLENGRPASEILPWLNDLPAVKDVLVAHFDGQGINKQNLSLWRQNGYLRWRKEKENILSAEKLGEYAQQFTQAAGGRFGPAAAAIASGKIIAFLESARAENAGPDDLVKFAAAASVLLKGEQNYTRLELARQRIRQKDDQLLLMRDKHQRDVVAIARRVVCDARIKEIEAADIGNDEKIELLGHYLFPKSWVSRPVPKSGNPEASRRPLDPPQSNPGPIPVKAESNLGQTPVQSQSNPGQGPVKAGQG